MLKKLHKHQVIAIILLTIGLLLMICSLFVNEKSPMIGIMQGLSTGLISGVVVLFVSGIKLQDQNCLSNRISIVTRCILLVKEVSSACGELLCIFSNKGNGESRGVVASEKQKYYEIKDKVQELQSILSNMLIMAYYDIPEIDKTELSSYINKIVILNLYMQRFNYCDREQEKNGEMSKEQEQLENIIVEQAQVLVKEFSQVYRRLLVIESENAYKLRQINDVIL